MNGVDLSPLYDNATQFEKLRIDVEEKYKGNWDDAVHDSFGRYVKQVSGYAEVIKSIRNDADRIKNEVMELDISGLVKYVETLREETENI